MATFGLIGYPLGHSRSMQFFSEKFMQLGDNAHSFINFPLTTIEELHFVFQHHPDLKGLAVTIPYKQAVIPWLHEIDEVAAIVGAVNCIQIRNGQRKGFNTDVIGIEKSLLALLGNERPDALVLGTGGASNAVAYVLKKMGISFNIVSRTLIQQGVLSYSAVDEKVLGLHHLIINCTPLGMYPEVTGAPHLPYAAITPNHYFFDLIYNPNETVFLSKAKQHGARIINGERMFVWQAEENWKIWNDGFTGGIQ